MTDEEYFKIDRLSNSGMKAFKLSPAHYLQAQQEEKAPSAAMRLGTAFHCAVLEPDKFEMKYRIMPKFDLRKTADKAKYQEWLVLEGVGSGIPAEDYAQITDMREACFKNKGVMELLEQVKETEKTILWKEPESGVELKGRVDALAGNFILDFKTTVCAEPGAFARQAWNYDMHRQAAMYLDGCIANEIYVTDFYFIAIEKVPPYGISINKCTKAFLEKGTQDYKKICEDFRFWLELGKPNVGYEFKSPYGFDLELPGWIK